MRRGSRGLHLDYVALHARYMAGESGTAIAAEIGIDFTGLYRSWQRRGLPMRSQRDAKLLLFAQRPELRENIRPAQAARRGATDPISRREQRANTREARQIGISDHEHRLAELLRQGGQSFRQQAAIGPYNVDFAFDDLRIALDIDGGGHNSRVRANRANRAAFIASRGWTVEWIETRRQFWIEHALRLVGLRCFMDGPNIVVHAAASPK